MWRHSVAIHSTSFGVTSHAGMHLTYDIATSHFLVVIFFRAHMFHPMKLWEFPSPILKQHEDWPPFFSLAPSGADGTNT